MRRILDLAPVTPNGLTRFGTHLFGVNGPWYLRDHVIRSAENKNTLIGGEYVRSLVSPHYTLAARTLLFARTHGRGIGR